MRHLLVGFTVIALAGSVRGDSKIIVDQTFTSGDRSVQNPPGLVAWYVAGASTNLGVRNGVLDLSSSNAQRDIWAYFPAVSLAIGDTLTLAIDFSFTTPPAQVASGLRIALASTNGVPPTTVNGAAPTGNYQGYGAFIDPSRATAATRLRKRNGPGASSATAALLEVNDGGLVTWNDLAAQTSLAGPAQANVTYTATLKVMRTDAAAARISVAFTGGGLNDANVFSLTDTTAAFTTFDTIALDLQGAVLSGDMLISRVRVVDDLNAARLSNLSVRTTMTSGQTLIVGGVVGAGSGNRNILVRAAGPALAGFGLTNAMADPRLELYDAAGALVLANDNWPASLASASTAVGAFPFAPSSNDAALLQAVGGAYSIQAKGTGGGLILVEAYDTGTTNSPRLINVSARNNAGIGDNILIAGFTISGAGARQLLIRGVGPSLAGYGVTGFLADPLLQVFDSASNKLLENDNWNSTLAPAFNTVGAFALAPGGKDSALIISLPAGSYTAQVKGADGGTGQALVEIYELP